MIRRLYQMIIRPLILSSGFSVVIILSSALDARADNTTLYGLTFDGKLVQINPATAEATQVRATIQSKFLPAKSLAFYGGSLYANIDGLAVGYHTPYGFFAFGPTAYDEQFHGYINASGTRNLSINLASAPDNHLYTIMSGPVSTPATDILVDINLSNPLTSTALANSMPYGDVTYPPLALTFANSTTAFVAQQYAGLHSTSIYILRLAKTSGVWSVTSTQVFGDANFTAGLAVDPTNSNIVYVGTGYDKNDSKYNQTTINPQQFENTYTDSALYKLDFSTSPPTNHYIGWIGTPGVVGYPGLVGLTFGPALSEIVSPPPMNPSPIPCQTAGCFWEPVREIIFN